VEIKHNTAWPVDATSRQDSEYEVVSNLNLASHCGNLPMARGDRAIHLRGNRMLEATEWYPCIFGCRLQENPWASGDHVKIVQVRGETATEQLIWRVMDEIPIQIRVHLRAQVTMDPFQPS
jgi:hypothetical protein